MKCFICDKTDPKELVKFEIGVGTMSIRPFDSCKECAEKAGFGNDDPRFVLKNLMTPKRDVVTQHIVTPPVVKKVK